MNSKYRVLKRVERGDSPNSRLERYLEYCLEYTETSFLVRFIDRENLSHRRAESCVLVY
jgi:hypothetical protein